jgi:hypothetical protein
MDTSLETMFDQAGCTGRPVVCASVIKVSIALEAETQFADGRLDPRERVILPATARTPGPVGFALFDDDVAASLRDLVVAMLTITDSLATDALLHRVGIDAVNASSARLLRGPPALAGRRGHQRRHRNCGGRRSRPALPGSLTTPLIAARKPENRSHNGIAPASQAR